MNFSLEHSRELQKAQLDAGYFYEDTAEQEGEGIGRPRIRKKV
jgi:hypothetical protein